MKCLLRVPQDFLFLNRWIIPSWDLFSFCSSPTPSLVLIYPRITRRVANTPAPTSRDLAPTATAGSPKTTEVVETLFLVALAEEEEEVAAAVDSVAVEEAAVDEEGGKVSCVFCHRGLPNMQ